VERDERGFIRTGGEVSAGRTSGSRAPTRLETSMPGVFAVGDVRAGSVQRVASAVGEGSGAIPYVHEDLAQSGPALERAAAAEKRPRITQRTRDRIPLGRSGR